MALNPSVFCNALDYYLDHLLVDLKHGRMEFLRDHGDRICAMLNGYASTRGRGTGNFGAYKLSCYASRSALALLQAAPAWSTTGKSVVQEHVIPLKVAGEMLVDFVKNTPALTNGQLLGELNRLVIPCVITTDENRELNGGKLNRSMPLGAVSPWARYHSTHLPNGNTLYSEIIALRPNLPHNGGPAYTGAVHLPNALQASGTPSCPSLGGLLERNPCVAPQHGEEKSTS